MVRAMLPKIYLETTIVSYLAAWPSRDLVISAHQQVTHEWWVKRRSDFELFVSQLVVQEAGVGDPAAAARRLGFLEDLPVLGLSDHARSFAVELVKRVPLPPKANVDALHVAVAAVNGMDFLLTWNCTHIANARLRGAFDALCRVHDFEPPVICTPEELMEDLPDGHG